ncbi:MAG: squalene/phytoene synthase family protein [Minwuia sp.]|uniref:squalene/phytoene synthase family protein n=1 Tax=Minwuia sp. TaxID=2493630 RepID=UPI003A83D4E6
MTAGGELIDDLRAQDPDRLYSALFASGATRDRLIGLYAFNLEVASTRERVSEPMLGQIRLQWWRDALVEIRGGAARRHPVAESLSGWMPDAGSAAFDLANALIDAREADMEDAPFETVDQLVGYAEATSSNLMRLALMALGVGEGPVHEKAVPAGRAYALAGILRAVPFLGAEGRVLLPGQLMAQHGIADARQSLGRRDPAKLKAVLKEIADIAESDISEAGSIRRVPKVGRPALLPLALARLYLKRLKAAGFDLSDPRIDPGNAARIVTLFRANLLG